MIAVIWNNYHLWSLKGRGGVGDEGPYKHLYQPWESLYTVTTKMMMNTSFRSAVLLIGLKVRNNPITSARTNCDMSGLQRRSNNHNIFLITKARRLPHSEIVHRQWKTQKMCHDPVLTYFIEASHKYYWEFQLCNIAIIGQWELERRQVSCCDGTVVLIVLLVFWKLKGKRNIFSSHKAVFECCFGSTICR